MTIAQIISLLEATSLSDTPDLEHTIESVCGSDMMSDVLAFIKKDVYVDDTTVCMDYHIDFSFIHGNGTATDDICIQVH